MGGALLSHSFIQFSVDGWGCVPFLLLDLMPNSVGQWGPPSKGPVHALLESVPQMLHQATTNPRLCQRLLDPDGQVWVSLLWGHCSFLLGPDAHKVLFLPSKSLFPQTLCKFWQLYDGVNGDLLQVGLCHTQVYCTQSCCPCSRPLLNQTSTGYTQTQFCLSLRGVSGSWCTQSLSPLTISGEYGV